MAAGGWEMVRLMAPLETPGEDGEVNIEDEDDNEPVKMAKDPGQPSIQQEKEHRVDHYPYRSWCKFCVMGRGIGFQHRRAPGSVVPRIGMDYFFITAGGMKKRDELTKEYPDDNAVEEGRRKGELVKCILVRDFESKMVFAHCVPCKGLDEEGYVASMIIADVRWLGYTQMILKGDNETAMQALIDHVVRKLKAEFEQDGKVERVTKEEPRGTSPNPMEAPRSASSLSEDYSGR